MTKSFALLLLLCLFGTAPVVLAVSEQQQDTTATTTTAITITTIPNITIGRDVHGRDVVLPLLGAGTWQYNDTIAYQSVCQAFQAGYTFVDTAFGYKNQKGVGWAIRDCWQGRRDDLFVMTKIPGGLSAQQVEAAHQQNLMELGLEYVDHLMTHFPADWDETVASPADRQAEWLALEHIYERGQARSIGLSHYCERHIEDILMVATSVLPSINQVEYHVGSQDVDHVMDACRHKYGITFMSFSPLCGPCEYEPEDSLIHGELVTEIATHYENVTASQVALRYIVQQGIPVIPKSSSAPHIASNRGIFNFVLSDEDMDRLATATKPPAEVGDCDVP
jgi:diketogulonate reductase-like aldo/keto reductase